MALTLAQSALYTTDDLQRGVIETFVQQSSVLDRIPLLTINGNAYAYNVEESLPGVEFRAVNSAYSESTGVINQKSERLVILGGDADVDTFLVQTRGNLNDLRAEQTAMKVKSANFKFQDAFINGDTAVDANSFDGIKKRVTGAQVISAATNGLLINTDNASRNAFFDKLDELLAACPNADALYMNSQIRSKILSAMRQLNQSIDRVGDKQEPSYQGVPLINIGTKADGTPIIPQTETQGTANDTSSIYAVKFGVAEADAGVTGLTNGGVQVKDLGEIDAKPVFRTRIEFFCGLGLFGGKAAARLSGLKNG